MKTISRTATKAFGCALSVLLACCAQRAARAPGAGTPAAPPAASAGAVVPEAEMAKMTPHDLAQYIFQNDGCIGCHTLSEQGKMGFTAHGREVAGHAEGCVDLMTAVTAIARKPETQWTAQERVRVDHFGEYGCTACHEISQEQLRTTPWGEKLVNLHMSCPEVVHLLSGEK